MAFAFSRNGRGSPAGGSPALYLDAQGLLWMAQQRAARSPFIAIYRLSILALEPCVWPTASSIAAPTVSGCRVVALCIHVHMPAAGFYRCRLRRLWGSWEWKSAGVAPTGGWKGMEWGVRVKEALHERARRGLPRALSEWEWVCEEGN
jgi:hypothetical protein